MGDNVRFAIERAENCVSRIARGRSEAREQWREWRGSDEADEDRRAEDRDRRDVRHGEAERRGRARRPDRGVKERGDHHELGEMKDAAG